MAKKGENIYKRKDKRWEARYVKEYRPDGSPKYGYCYGKTYREAREKVLTAKIALRTGTSKATIPNKARLAYYCDEWLRLRRDRVKPSTYVKYSNSIEKHIKPRLGGIYVRKLSTAVVEQFSHDLLYEEELAPKTVKDVLTMLRSVIQYAVAQFSEPMPAIEITYPKVPKSNARVLSREEQTRFIQYLLRDMDECKFGVLLSLLTGMRIGEVCALRWESVSLSEKTVKVISTMQRLRNLDEDGEKTKVVISDPKSDYAVRVIPLTDYAVNLCKTQRCSNPSAYILTGRSDSYVEPRTMQYKLNRYTNDCGLEGVHFHTLRHTFATRCVEVDFEIKSLSEILGHSTPRIPLERYVHSSMELKRSNMNKLNAIGF